MRLRDLFDEFLGPISYAFEFVCITRRHSARNKSKKWEPLVVVCDMHSKTHGQGISKRRLLKSVILPLVAKNRELQRLVAEYTELRGQTN